MNDKQTIDPGPNHRLLAPDEIIREGDEHEWNYKKGWDPTTYTAKHAIKAGSQEVAYRRPIRLQSEGWRYLDIGESFADGDQVWTGASWTHMTTGAYGQIRSEKHTSKYRRPLPQPSKEESWAERHFAELEIGKWYVHPSANSPAELLAKTLCESYVSVQLRYESGVTLIGPSPEEGPLVPVPSPVQSEREIPGSQTDDIEGLRRLAKNLGIKNYREKSELEQAVQSEEEEVFPPGTLGCDDLEEGDIVGPLPLIEIYPEDKTDYRWVFEGHGSFNSHAVNALLLVCPVKRLKAREPEKEPWLIAFEKARELNGDRRTSERAIFHAGWEAANKANQPSTLRWEGEIETSELPHSITRELFKEGVSTEGKSKVTVEPIEDKA